jgi:hypothetical protein
VICARHQLGWHGHRLPVDSGAREPKHVRHVGVDIGGEIERRFGHLVERSDLRVRQDQVERGQVRLKLV